VKRIINNYFFYQYWKTGILLLIPVFEQRDPGIKVLTALIYSPSRGWTLTMNVPQTFQTRGLKHATKLRPQTHYKPGASNTLQTRGLKYATDQGLQTRYRPGASNTLQTRGLKHATNQGPQIRYKPGVSNTLQTRGLKHATNLTPQTWGPWAT